MRARGIEPSRGQRGSPCLCRWPILMFAQEFFILLEEMFWEIKCYSSNRKTTIKCFGGYCFETKTVRRIILSNETKKGIF